MISQRQQRANAQIHKALQMILHEKMNDPRISDFVGVSDVSVTGDFHFCKVKISLTDGKYENAPEILSVLKKSEGFIKNELAKLVNMPYVPKLDFVFDKNMQNVINVENILKNLNIPKEENGSDD